MYTCSGCGHRFVPGDRIWAKMPTMIFMAKDEDKPVELIYLCGECHRLKEGGQGAG